MCFACMYAVEKEKRKEEECFILIGGRRTTETSKKGWVGVSILPSVHPPLSSVLCATRHPRAKINGMTPFVLNESVY